jgi:hypothetical protein
VEPASPVIVSWPTNPSKPLIVVVEENYLTQNGSPLAVYEQHVDNVAPFESSSTKRNCHRYHGVFPPDKILHPMIDIHHKNDGISILIHPLMPEYMPLMHLIDSIYHLSTPLSNIIALMSEAINDSVIAINPFLEGFVDINDAPKPVVKEVEALFAFLTYSATRFKQLSAEYTENFLVIYQQHIGIKTRFISLPT